MEQKDHPWIGVDNIILNDRGQILLMQRSSQTRTYPNQWGLISGWMEWGETIQDALKREAQEEVGVEIEVIRFTGRYYDRPGRHPTKTSVAMPHICRIIRGEPKINQPEEVQNVKWFDPDEIRDLDMAYDHKQMLIDEGLI
ncbi:MAG: NUDIX hydrolase [Candidatus Woesearchaeota archaeon]